MSSRPPRFTSIRNTPVGARLQFVLSGLKPDVYEEVMTGIDYHIMREIAKAVAQSRAREIYPGLPDETLPAPLR